jgi:hypothetical protein
LNIGLENMDSINIQTEAQEKPAYFIRKFPSPSILRRRLPVVLLLLYYVWILLSAWSMSGMWWWSLEEGLMWSHGGPGSFFPIPSVGGIAAVITPANLIDQVFYLIFMHSGIWIVWIIFGLLYLFSPYRLDVRVVIERLSRRGSSE